MSDHAIKTDACCTCDHASEFNLACACKVRKIIYGTPSERPRVGECCDFSKRETGIKRFLRSLRGGVSHE